MLGLELTMTDARFSRIVIIQSLPSIESQTGRHLRDAIEPTAKALRHIPVEFVEAPTASDFWTALDRVHKTIENSMDYPILHLECHGLSDKTGLSLADRTPVTWIELKAVLVRLNQATCCNLLVTLAACHGAMLMETLDVHDRSPCWGLLGPSGEVSPPDLKSSYSAFFLELLRSANTEAACFSLRDSPDCRAKYFLFTAEDMFRDVFRVYRATCSTKDQMTERADRFAQIFKKHGMPDDEVSSIRPVLYEEEYKVLERFYKRFFFVDRCPKNGLRFNRCIRGAYSMIRDECGSINK